MSFLTCRISPVSAVLPGQHHTRTGMPSRVTAIPTMTWGRSSRESLDFPLARNPARPASSSLPAGRAPALVAGNLLVGLFGLEQVLVVSKKRRSTSRLRRSVTW